MPRSAHQVSGEACQEGGRRATGNEVQEGPIEEETERPQRWRVATVEDDIVRRDGELADEDREQWGEGRRPPGDVDENPIADTSGRPKVDEGGFSDWSWRAGIEDRKVEVGGNAPELRVTRRCVRGSPKPREVGECAERPIAVDGAGPAHM